MDNLIIDTDPAKLDIAYMTAFLSQTYWAQGRSQAQMQQCVDHSLNFGVYLQGSQIGYARVVSDTVQFAYLMDVFIDPLHRGKGYSLQLVDYILQFPELRNVRVWRLASNDARGLYGRFGFTPLAHPEKMMERIRP
ncbi:GNAT family N-acetyltransferase [Rurimicrobium arvi]|uniref:GNAT family N-acetyltransferase n=1 Tax=Rurimicrobium arvi TaxID=2049916 RepID=A0ABP8MWJ9_9BACT